MEHDRAVELHGETVPVAESEALVAPGDVDAPLEHPHLLVDAHVARAGLEGDACARWKLDLDDLEGLADAGRRDVATQIARRRVTPLGLVDAPRDGTGGERVVPCRGVEQARERHAESHGQLLEHDGGRTALAALDDGDHRAADAAARGEGVEGESARGAQVADTVRDPGVEGGVRRRILHAGSIFQHNGHDVKLSR